MVVENFIFNEDDNYKSVVLQSIYGDIKVLSLDNENFFDINCSLDDTYGLKIRDFYKKNILLTSYKDICIININTMESKSVINQNDDFPSIKYIKLLDDNRYVIITYSYKYLKVYDFEGKEIINKKLDDVSYSNFISNNKIVTTSIRNSSRTINIDTNEVMKFDIGYTFHSDNVLLFDNEKYSIYINTDIQMNYYIECFDLSKEENGRAIKIWKNGAPWLSKFKPLGYCKKDKHIYLINKNEGEIVALEISRGNIVSLYKIEESIDDIKISNSGEYIAWKLKTGEFSYIKYPFKAHKIENNKTWRRQYHYENDKVLLNPTSSVAELWWEAFNRVNNTSFRSSSLNAHQLEPLVMHLKLVDKSIRV